MDDLSALLRAASDGAPPTGFDLDELIAADRRRRRGRWVAVAAAAAVLMTAGTAAVLSGPDSEPAPKVAASPTGVAPCEHASLPPSWPGRTIVPRRSAPRETSADAARRLTGALAGLLPEGARPGSRARCDRVEFYFEKRAGDFRAMAWVGTGPDEYSLAVTIRPAEAGTRARCLNDDDSSCTRLDQPGGAIAMADLVVGGTDPQRSVTVYRPDDTVVLLVAIGRVQILPADTELAAIGAAPQLTLYP